MQEKNACMHAFVRACVRVCVRACVREYVVVTSLSLLYLIRHWEILRMCADIHMRLYIIIEYVPKFDHILQVSTLPLSGVNSRFF